MRKTDDGIDSSKRFMGSRKRISIDNSYNDITTPNIKTAKFRSVIGTNRDEDKFGLDVPPVLSGGVATKR